MNWILLSLLAPFLYTFVNFIDKYVVEHKVRDSRGMPVYGTIVASIFGTGLWLVTGMPTLDLRNGTLLLLSGAITMQGFALYFYALAKSHTSYIIALLQTTPIFTLIIASLVLHDRLSWQQLVGFFVVFIAVIGLSIDRVERKIKFDKSFYAITFANVLFAVAAVTIKFTSGLNDLVPILVYESWGIAIGGVALLLLVRSVRKAFLQSFWTVGKQTLVIMFMNEVLFIVTKAMTFLAITMAPVALVTVLAGTAVFYGFFIGAILTVFVPKIFKEDISRYALIKNGALSVILFAGVWLVGFAN